MSFNLDDLTVGGQAKFGTGMYLQTIREGDHKINGSIGAEGPVHIGNPYEFSSLDATVMIGSLINSNEDFSSAYRKYFSVLSNGFRSIEYDSKSISDILFFLEL